MALARDRNLPGRTVEELLARDLFQHVRIDMTRLQEIDAMLKAHPVDVQRCKLAIFHGKLGIGHM